MNRDFRILFDRYVSAFISLQAFLLVLIMVPIQFAQAQSIRKDSIVLSVSVSDKDSMPVYNSSLSIGDRLKVRIPASIEYLKVAVQKRKPIGLTAFKEGYQPWKGLVNISPNEDTVSVFITLEKVPVILRKVEVTSTRIRQQVNEKAFYVYEYGLSEEGLLLYGKENEKPVMKYYTPQMKLKDVRILPESTLEFHQDCMKRFYLFVKDKLYKLELKDHIQVVMDFNEGDFFKYKSSKCLFYVDSNYFFSYKNFLGSRTKFYYSCFNCDSSYLLFEYLDYVKESKIQRFPMNVYKQPVDFANTFEQFNTLTAEDLKSDVTYLSERYEFYKKVVLRPQKWEFHHAYDHYWMLDIEGKRGFKASSKFVVSDTFSLEVLNVFAKGWAGKFVADEEYNRLYTTYVQGDTRVVEVKGEKLDQTETVATIPFNGYFPEKLKIRGSYLYYLMFDGKKRVLYRHRLEGT